MNAPSREMVAALAVALMKMKDAGLADYGGIPKEAEALRQKATTYAEALLPDDERPSEPVIDAACVASAVRRLLTSSHPRDGERLPIPSSGDLRALCLDEWHRLYRHVSLDLVNADGLEVSRPVRVRRDWGRAECAQAVEACRTLALAEGCREIAPALPASPESAARMRRVLAIGLERREMEGRKVA